jgi:hypothetical protein
MAELKYWVWLSSVAGMGPGNVRRLLERFESPDQVFFAQREEFEALGWLSAGAINALCAKKLYQAVEIIDRCAAHGWQILTVRMRPIPSGCGIFTIRPWFYTSGAGCPIWTGRPSSAWWVHGTVRPMA